ncbi:dihydromonapterin reductase [Saccharobesus litoralis]|uniref:Dihydromonapterin reductase n=1 Tax=Saccharobesus litoralis TaxID=2172099 RepID=A0A2S0VRN7_9ALTE|nr:dihydromonapterin reductase [Saccharobesus litoralis]AWB66853.1 dihydromonapterin reductase [Saccharobesus litoralis]
MTNNVLITGVGKRLGFVLAKHLLANKVNVIGTYRTDYAQLDELRDAGAVLYQCDFYQQASVDELIETILQHYSSLAGIVHNASDWLPDNADLPHSEIMQRMMAVHVSVPYQLNLALANLLQANASECSDIIHISDYVAEKGSKKHIAYAASKAAMNNMTLSFATLLAPKIKVNSISPALLKFNPDDDDAYQQKALSKGLIQTQAGFEEVIKAIDFIRSSRFMTGRNLHLDGGRHLK